MAGAEDLTAGEEAEIGREWYFAEDGTLAQAGAPRLQEWLGVGYTLVGLALSSPQWLGPVARVEGRRQGADAGARVPF